MKTILFLKYQYIICIISFLISSISLTAQTNAFITQWSIPETNTTLELPTYGTGYDYQIDWGDGSVEQITSDTATHTYANHGIYDITIAGIFPRMKTENFPQKEQLKKVKQWGTIVWDTMQYMFAETANLEFTATDAPNLTAVTNMSYMFSSANSISGNFLWNTETITNMQGMFSGTTNFVGDISTWNVSSVTDMNFMFSCYDSSFGSLATWNVSSLTNMDNMFYANSDFTDDLSAWNVGNVTSMNSTFFYATNFESDLSAWNVSNVTNMDGMFKGALKFNSDLSNWDVSKVNRMDFIFSETNLSVINYSKILQKWAGLNLQNNISLDVPVAYCAMVAQQRQKIIDDFGWIINDEGETNEGLCITLSNDAETLETHTTIYPNPSTALVTVKSVGNIKTISLYSAIGNLVLTSTQNPIDLTQLASGIYLIKISTSTGKSIMRRLIKN